MILENPYLHEFLALPVDHRANGEPINDQEQTRGGEYHAHRQHMVNRYSWAVPTRDAIEAIKARSVRVLELGAGSGYWAYLMAQVGIDVLAFDPFPPQQCWYPIHIPTPETPGEHSDRALLLCWPPRHHPMAFDALSAYRGDTVIYVGEHFRGNAEGFFFNELWKNWREIDRVEIPRWFNRTDDLRAYTRVRSCFGGRQTVAASATWSRSRASLDMTY